jgi:ketosteroid isomerase-like protein
MPGDDIRIDVGDRRLPLKSLSAGFLLAILIVPPAATQSPEAEIRAALTQWTSDFNAGRADKVCDLFAPSLRADVRGAAERDFDTQCQLLRKALADPERTDSEAFELKEILAEGDMAAVRLVWTTTTRIKATGEVSTSVYQGLDVFGRGSDGIWRIIRYMAYERP